MPAAAIANDDRKFLLFTPTPLKRRLWATVLYEVLDDKRIVASWAPDGVSRKQVTGPRKVATAA
jgi:hypothetical protein